MLDSSTTAGDTTGYTYDAGGRHADTTDPRGEVTTNCYYDENASGQCAHSAPAGGGIGDDSVLEHHPGHHRRPSGETTTYTYFPGGALDTTTTPAGHGHRCL